MRIRSYSITLFILLCFFCCVTEAYCSLLNTDLVFNIKPNPKVSSKPTTIKLASVNFIASDYKPNINYISKEAELCLESGYTTRSCTGLLPGDVCPYEPTYMSGCCELDYQYVSSSSCVAPLSADEETCGGKYRCYCDRAKFPYGKDRECESPNIFNSDRKSVV